MSKIFENQNLTALDIDELQNNLDIQFPVGEGQRSAGVDKPTDSPDESINRPERKHRYMQFFALLCLFAAFGVAAPSG